MWVAFPAVTVGLRHVYTLAMRWLEKRSQNSKKLKSVPQKGDKACIHKDTLVWSQDKSWWLMWPHLSHDIYNYSISSNTSPRSRTSSLDILCTNNSPSFFKAAIQTWFLCLINLGLCMSLYGLWSLCIIHILFLCQPVILLPMEKAYTV